MLMNIFKTFKLKCNSIFPAACRGHSCITVCPAAHSCSASASECGLSVSARRCSLSRWSRTDLTSADKLYLAESSCVFAGTLPPPALHKSVAIQSATFWYLLCTRYLSDTRTHVVWSCHFSLSSSLHSLLAYSTLFFQHVFVFFFFLYAWRPESDQFRFFVHTKYMLE